MARRLMRRCGAAFLLVALAAASILAGCAPSPQAGRPVTPRPAATAHYDGRPVEPTQYAFASRTLLDPESGKVTKIPGTQHVVPGPVYGNYTVGLVASTGLTRVAFGPRMEMKWDLVAFDVRTGTTRALMRGGEWWPVVSGGWVAWEHDLDAGDSAIYASSIDTASAIVPVCLDSGMQSWPQISGRWIVWNDGDRGARSYDLETGRSRVLSPTGVWPMVSGDWAIWSEYGGSIHARNLATDEAQLISPTGTTEEYDNGSAAIGGPWFAWLDGAKLRAINLDTGQRRSTPAPSGDPDRMVIAGDSLVWHQWHEVGRIHSLDLRTGHVRTLASGDSAANGPIAVGHWVLWDDADSRVYWADAASPSFPLHVVPGANCSTDAAAPPLGALRETPALHSPSPCHALTGPPGSTPAARPPRTACARSTSTSRLRTPTCCEAVSRSRSTSASAHGRGPRSRWPSASRA